MANVFDWFFEQLVTSDEMDEAFANLEAADHALVTDQSYFGVYNGLGVTQQTVPDLTVQVANGTAYDQQGQRTNIPTSQSLDLSVDSNASSTAVVAGGNEKWVSVFVRFTRALSDQRFDGNGSPVNFRRDESFEFLVLQGAEAPAGTASRPALQADAILIADVLLDFGKTQIFDADIESSDTVAAPTSRFQFAFDLTSSSPATVRVGPLPDAMQAILTELNNHITNVANPHPASAITFSGTNIAARYPTWAAAVEVQEAFDDLSDDLEQLIRTTNLGNITYGIESGILPVDQGGLDVQVQTGRFWFNGRLYEPTQAQINASSGTNASGEITVTDDEITYIGIRPTGGLLTNDEDSLEVSTSTTEFPAGYCPAGVVVAESADIIQIYGVYDVLPGPLYTAHVAENFVVLPKLAHGNFGADPGFTPDIPREWSGEWSMVAQTTDDEVLNLPLGPHGWFQQDASPPTLEIPQWVEDVWPVGSIIMFEVDVLGTQITGNDTEEVQVVRKLIGNSRIHLNPNPSVSNGTWTVAHTFDSAQAAVQNVAVSTGGGTNSGLMHVQVDGGSGTTGIIRWYLHVKIRVVPGANDDAGSYIVTRGIKLGDPTNR